MNKEFKSMWATLCDRTQKVSSRLTALLGLLVPVITLVVLVVILVVFAQKVLPGILGGAFLIYLVFGDYIDAAIQRKKITKDQHDLAQKQMEDAIYRKIAIMLIPTMSQVTAMDLEPEDIVYDLGVSPFGTGFYYSTPRLLSEDEVRHLRQLLVMKLHGRIQVSRTDIGRERIVLVRKDMVFVRNDPRVIQYFTTND